MSKDAPLLHLAHLHKNYVSGESLVPALEDINLSIWAGEFIAIMGQSGSGKSTLMNILGCLDRASSGQYQVAGEETLSLSQDALAGLRSETFGFIFQRYNLLATSTAVENIEIPAIYAGVKKSERLQRALALLHRLGLEDRACHRPWQLSGGQQQRVAVARALMNNPAVILADEPTGALDSKSGADLMALLEKLNQEGRTIILITHDEQVARHAKRVIRLRDGKIIEDSGSAQREADPAQDVPAGNPHKKANPTQPFARHNPFSIIAEMAEAAKMALRALQVNLFRTLLTLLGIIIGVASVVTMMAVGDGSKQDVLDQMTKMGTNLLSVRPGAPGFRGAGDVATLTTQDAEAMLALPNLEQLVPERRGRYTARVGNLDYATAVQAVGAGLPQVRDWPLSEGSFFNKADISGYAPVAVIGTTVKDHLFPDGQSPLGQFILVRNVPFEVIGVLQSKGESSYGGDQDDAIFVPISTGMIRLFGRPYLSSITVKVADLAAMSATEEEISRLLLERHHTEDFSIRNMAAMLDMATQTQNTLTVLLGTVAAISLLVGGIGVMNIMLVSVSERTREIGIRMATGAKMRDILLQFNTEAMVVCTIGGLLGVALGLLAGWGISLFGTRVIFSVLPAVVAFSCAFLISLVFGYLPARKAARLDPVVALASE